MALSEKISKAMVVFEKHVRLGERARVRGMVVNLDAAAPRSSKRSRKRYLTLKTEF
jgi:hypothetical protein